MHLEDVYNKKIDDILAVINALDIICQIQKFRHWISSVHRITDETDLLTGYVFLVNILTRRLHDEIATNVSLGLTEDESFYSADHHGTPLDRLPDSGEKVLLLRAIRKKVESILNSLTWDQAQESLESFRQDIVEPFWGLKQYSQLNQAYQIASIDEAIRYSTMNEVFVFLNDTSEQVPHGYPVPTLDNKLWRNSRPEVEQYLSTAFKGYKYSNQYLWFMLLGNEFSLTSLAQIHEAKDWDEFDGYFYTLRPIIEKIEKRLRISLGMAPTVLISKNAKSVLRPIFRARITKEKLNELETLEHLFQWYQVEIVDASRDTLFNGVPAVLSIVAGSVELRKRINGPSDPVRIIKLIHQEDSQTKRNTYSYAILMGVHGWVSDASGWLLFFGCCYDFTGTGRSQLQQVDNLISEYSKIGLVKLFEHRVTETKFLNLMEPYLLFPPRSQKPRVSPNESRLKEIRETAEINKILHETMDMLGTASGLLLEFIGHYEFNNPANSRIEWNYMRNGSQIDLITKTENELRFFECKKPMGDIVAQVEKFEAKVRGLICDPQFHYEWGFTSNPSPTLTFVVWRRPDPRDTEQLINRGVDIIVLQELLKTSRKFKGKKTDKIYHVFGG
jgi:hypothetical protein